jgi:hypothetical protein
MSPQNAVPGLIRNPRKKKFWVAIFILIFTLVLVITFMIILKIDEGNNGDNTRDMASNATTGTGDSGLRQGETEVNWQGMLSEKPVVQGGVIRFSPDGGEYAKPVRVRLAIDAPLKSKRGDVIASYIGYTLDSTDPTRTNGSKYTTGKSISLSQERTYTLKARLISKVGIYEGDVYKQEYTILSSSTQPIVSQPDKTTGASTFTTSTRVSRGEDQFIAKGIQPQGTITDFNLLDRQVQEEINEKLRSFLISGEGITGIIISGELKLLIAVSKVGKANLIDISGFNVEPEEKMDLLKSRLNIKIQNINFPVPTSNGEQVNVEVWLNFKKIMLFSSMVIFEK